MEKAKLMQLEIEKKRKLPRNLKRSINLEIFLNLIAAIIVLAYLASINVIFYRVEKNVFEEYMKYFALGIIIVTIVVLDVAYRKDSFKIGIIATELLVCGILSLYIPYIYVHTTSEFRNMIMILPVFLVIYYVIKAIAIFKHREINYINNLSDVREIMQNSEKKEYLDEESSKSFRKKLKEEEKIKEEIKNEQKLRRLKKQLANKVK